MKIYHNPRCGKSREALQILTEADQSVEVIEYLKTPPSVDELKEIVTLLEIRAESLVRKKESVFIQNFAGKDFSDSEWIRIMAENPILIERPIVIAGNKAVIGRAPENVKKLL